MADNDHEKLEEEITELKNDLTNTNIEENTQKHSEESPEREITQTDHLNKRLLSAFLNRINVNPTSIPQNSIQVSQNDTSSDTEDNTKQEFIDTEATNSGKSTLVDQLLATLPNCSAIHQDDYYLEVGDDRLSWIPELNHNNWDEINALEMDRLVSDIQCWMADTTQFGSTTNTAILLVDGFLLYNYKPLDKLFNKKYFLTISETVCRNRRSQRVYVPPDVPGYFDKVVWPTYLVNLKEIRDQSDIIFLDGTDKQQDIFQRVLKEILSFTS